MICGLPMHLLDLIAGQEVGDVSFVVEHGVGTFCNEHFKRLPRSLQTGLVPKLMSSSRLHKMHINLHNLMWFLNQCNAWMICLSWEWVNIESNLCHPFTELLTVIFIGSTIYSNHQSILYPWPMKISLRLPFLHPSRPLPNAHKVNFK
ncbi:hypothetical protein BDL97_06G062000 [Sphagnum fallax]|nr:hypothetical protein BDL97_06G062000 [Sphagnum fallax]